VIDDFCKQLVARHPASVGRWVLGRIAEDNPLGASDSSGSTWQLLDRELSTAPLHADSVVLLPEGNTSAILHLEFQTRPDAAIAERMLDYWIRLHRRFHQPIRQAVIHLKPTRSRLARVEELAIDHTRHRFSSLRLWEQDPAPLLADPGLLPLAVLARSTSPSPDLLLRQVQQRLQAIADPDQRRLTGSGCQLLAGLTFPPDVIQRLLAMSILEDSSVYQLIKRKGLEEGRVQGLVEGRVEGLDQGRRQEALDLLGRQLLRRCGPLNTHQDAAIAALPLETLEQLGEALLDFNSPEDFNRWLAALNPGP
jgi:predicted transposase/invertase (TIGR01784 family)